MRYSLFSIAAASALFVIGLSSTAEAKPCDPATCIHPACVCPSVKPPKGLDPKTVPQFFTLTFDDAVQGPTVPVTEALMKGFTNPNGCPIKATWFTQTLYSDFSLIQQFYAKGNEVADHTMNHIGTPPANEIMGNRKSINAFSGIPFAKLNGFRAPFLNYSASTFQILAQEGFLYDSSTAATASDPYWPYTLDNGLANDCWNGICDANLSLPGFWEVPMHAIMDGDNSTSIPHSMDVHLEGTADAVAGWLTKNFDRHYNGDRAPFGIYLHPVHLGNAASLYTSLFTHARANPDVWFVTNQQLLEWMKNPVPNSELANQPYMKCNLPAVGKEICNGLDDLNIATPGVPGTPDKGVLEVCNFVSGPWSTCYGCPKTAPTPENPVPERNVALGALGARTPVPATCAMEWWDPIAAQCLCTNSNCTFTDTAIPVNKDGTPASNTPGSSSHKSDGGANIITSISWGGFGVIAAAAAGLAQLL
ncbi:hypothetical protein BGZ76_009239 [Entomortierella beljakovae]|nr:hypothetical protein BGZ76_009239 [Entomortierella beljakovae]